MILKKPYAFLIRHFRLLHIIMVVCIIFLLRSTNDIYQLFSTLQKTNTYTYAGAGIYINNIVYYAILVLIFLSGTIYWLFKEKKKPNILYILMLLYAIVLLIAYPIIFGILSTIQEELLSTDTIILVKDICFLLTLPQYIILVFTFIRAIGFNIKQFNFSKDIEELEIVDKDSQEFELLIGQNNYKYFRTIRRTIREIKYYILENKFAISCIFAVILIILGGFGIYYYNVNMKKYSETELISVNSISYVVNKSYITAYDYNGKRIKDGFKYVVVDMTFYNSSLNDKVLNLDLITLTNGKLVYYPTTTKNSKFYDLGLPYLVDTKISSQEYLDGTLVFEIPDSVNSKSYTLRVQYDLDTSLNDVIAKYRNFDVNATNIDAPTITKTYSFNETINSDIVGQNKLSLTIKGYSFMDSYDNHYVTCQSINSCKPVSSIISSTVHGTSTMLVLNFNGLMYDDANITKTFNSYIKLFSNFCIVKYKVNNKEYNVMADIVNKEDVDGKIFINVDRNIINAKEVSIEFNFRNEVYIIPLKTNQ